MRLYKEPVTPGVISEIIAKGMQDLNCGAHSLFIGQIKRDQIGGRFLRAVEYSAYEEMVIKEANNITKTILSEFDGIRSIEILHSTGQVKAGEIFLVVMISAQNSGHASKACVKAVDLIIEKLPVLKKELFEEDHEDSKTDEYD